MFKEDPKNRFFFPPLATCRNVFSIRIMNTFPLMSDFVKRTFVTRCLPNIITFQLCFSYWTWCRLSPDFGTFVKLWKLFSKTVRVRSEELISGRPGLEFASSEPGCGPHQAWKISPLGGTRDWFDLSGYSMFRSQRKSYYGYWYTV